MKKTTDAKAHLILGALEVGCIHILVGFGNNIIAVSSVECLVVLWKRKGTWSGVKRERLCSLGVEVKANVTVIVKWL